VKTLQITDLQYRFCSQLHHIIIFTSTIVVLSKYSTCCRVYCFICIQCTCKENTDSW